MLEYYRNLRNIVGSHPLITVAATVAPVKNREIMLQRRTDDGTWGLHGGAMDMGETIYQTARREFFEETGYTAEKLELWDVYSGEAHHHIYPNGDEVYVVDVVFICKEFSGEQKIQESEVSEIKWFPLSSLPEDIFPLDKVIITDIAQRL